MSTASWPSFTSPSATPHISAPELTAQLHHHTTPSPLTLPRRSSSDPLSPFPTCCLPSSSPLLYPRSHSLSTLRCILPNPRAARDTPPSPFTYWARWTLRPASRARSSLGARALPRSWCPPSNHHRVAVWVDLPSAQRALGPAFHSTTVFVGKADALAGIMLRIAPAGTVSLYHRSPRKFL